MQHSDKDFFDAKTQYFTVYWLGLMDAIGSIQVNHNKKSDKLEYNFSFKLPPSYSSTNTIWHFNEFSAGLLKNGNRNKKTKNYVFLINCNEEKFSNIIENTFKKYSNFPLTSRLKCQLFFAESCLANGKTWYCSNRKNKYLQQNSIIKEMSEKRIRETDKFGCWLSGFLHGKSKCKTFNNQLIYFIDKLDEYIAEEIQYVFDMTSKPSKNNRGNCYIRIHNQKVISKIKDHFLCYTILNLELVKNLSEGK